MAAPSRTRRRGVGGRGRLLAVVLAGAMALSGCALVPSASEATGPNPSGGGASEPAKEPPHEPAPAPDDAAELAKFYTQKLNWEKCGEGGFECTTFEVPRDYAEPDGATLELAVLRVRATGGAERKGSLVLNPGGPGGSAVDFAAQSPLLVSPEVRKAYDMVGFDPRGVGKSAPVRCGSTEERDEFAAADGTPDDAKDLAELERLSKRMVAGCEKRSGDVLPYVSTENTVRDMDVLRGALGDPKLTYLGMSYGTSMGATYAELFPKRVGRFVLDGALDPSMNELEINLQQAKGFEQAMDAFLEDCVQGASCPLGTEKQEAYERLQKLLADIDANPLPTSDGRKVTEAIALSGIIMPLYVEALWPRLRSAIQSALSGDGDPLLSNADQYSDRDDSGYTTNSGEAIYAVNCLDRPSLGGVDELKKLEPRFAKEAPMFGPPILWGTLPCAYWPAKPVSEPHPIKAPGTAPIVVVGTTRDPATPYEWSKALASQLDSGVLLTRDGDGHTGYAQGNDCVDSAVNTFFLKGTPPKDGKRC